MKCHTGRLFDVDRHNFVTFLSVIKPFVTDPSRYDRLKQGFPSPRPITSGPCTRPTSHKESSTSSTSSSQPIPPPKSLPRVLLQRIDVPRKRRSPSPVPHQPAPKQRWLSSSPSRHSCPARNLREVETRIHELEREVLRLTPRVTAVTSELQALRSSVATLKRGSSDWVSTLLHARHPSEWPSRCRGRHTPPLCIRPVACRWCLSTPPVRLCVRTQRLYIFF